MKYVFPFKPNVIKTRPSETVKKVNTISAQKYSTNSTEIVGRRLYKLKTQV